VAPSDGITYYSQLLDGDREFCTSSAICGGLTELLWEGGVSKCVPVCVRARASTCVRACVYECAYNCKDKRVCVNLCSVSNLKTSFRNSVVAVPNQKMDNPYVLQKH
jgi:hypothetical protein